MGTLLSVVFGAMIGVLALFLTPGAKKSGQFASMVFVTFMGGVIGALASESPVFDLSLPAFIGTVVGGLIALAVGVRAYAPAAPAMRMRRVSII